MAVYTEVSDDELMHFLASYDIGELLSFKGIAEGVENSNFSLHTTEGPFILTLYEKRVDPRDLPFFLGLMEHLANFDFSCPTPVRDRQGRYLRELSGRPAAIITFLEGIWIRKPKNLHCAEVGASLAKLHIAGKSFKMSRPNSLSVSDWRSLYESFGRDADKIAEGLSAQIENELNFLEKNWPTNLPGGIIHADLFPDNVFFLENKISGFIDFYFACNEILAYDLAICLNAWCFETDVSFNITKAKALLNAYSEVRSITAQEFEALPLLARGAALRFLLTRAHDWLNTSATAFVNPKDPIEYLRKLRFHQSVRTASEYGLEHQA